MRPPVTTIDEKFDLAGRAGNGAALVEGSDLRRAPAQVEVTAVQSATKLLVDPEKDPSPKLALLGVQTVHGRLGANAPRRLHIQLVDAETGASERHDNPAGSGGTLLTGNAGDDDETEVSNDHLSSNHNYRSAAADTAAGQVAATGQPIDGLVSLDPAVALALLAASGLPLPDYPPAGGTSSPTMSLPPRGARPVALATVMNTPECEG